MDWQVTKARILRKALSVAAAALDLAARYVPRLARRKGAVSAFLDGRTVTVAVIRRQNRHSRAEVCISVPLGEDALTNPDAAGQAIRRVLDGVRRPPRAFVGVVGAELIFERKIALPPMPVEETDAAVEFQADRVFPFPASEMRIDYAVESAGAEGIQSIIISGITDETARKIEQLSKAAGLVLEAIVAGPCALYAAVAGDAAAGIGRAVICRRADGADIAVGTTGTVAMSRFVRTDLSSDVSDELRHTASAAGIDPDGIAAVYVSSGLSVTLSKPGAVPGEVRGLEAALEAATGASCETPGAAPAIAAGTLYVRGAVLPDFHAPARAARRRKRDTALRARLAKYAALAAIAAAFVALCLTGYWVYAVALESKAARLALANASLKAAAERADIARPWMTGRTALLDVLSGVTDVFPGSPAAFAKSLSVAESGKVSLQGKVGDPKAAYDLVAALSRVKGFRNVKLDNGAADPSGGYNFAISFEADYWRARK